MANEKHLAKLREGRKAWNAWFSGEPIDLARADIRGLDLAGYNLSNVDFSYSELIDTSLARCILYDAHFVNCNLTRTDFEGAVMWDTILTGVSLASARGLDSVIHHGESSIGLDTFFRSGGL